MTTQPLPPLCARLARASQRSLLLAERAALTAFTLEWDAARAAVQRVGHPDPGPLPRLATTTSTDRAAAHAAAGSLAAAWLIATTSAVRVAASADEPLPAAVHAAALAQDFRVRRVATTETARATTDARDEGAGWVEEQHREASWFPLLLKSWDATLDRRTCPRCSALHGITRPFGLPFPGGAEPGHLHPGCRCLSATLLLPIPRAGAGEPSRAVDDEHPRAA